MKKLTLVTKIGIGFGILAFIATFIVVFYNYIYHSPRWDGERAINEICDCNKKLNITQKKVIEDFYHKNDSSKFSDIWAAQVYLDSLLIESDYEGKICLKKANEYFEFLKNIHITDFESVAKFQYAYNQQEILCNKINLYNIDSLIALCKIKMGKTNDIQILLNSYFMKNYQCKVRSFDDAKLEYLKFYDDDFFKSKTKNDYIKARVSHLKQNTTLVFDFNADGNRDYAAVLYKASDKNKKLFLVIIDGATNQLYEYGVRESIYPIAKKNMHEGIGDGIMDMCEGGCMPSYIYWDGNRFKSGGSSTAD